MASTKHSHSMSTSVTLESCMDFTFLRQNNFNYPFLAFAIWMKFGIARNIYAFPPKDTSYFDWMYYLR